MQHFRSSPLHTTVVPLGVGGFLTVEDWGFTLTLRIVTNSAYMTSEAARHSRDRAREGKKSSQGRLPKKERQKQPPTGGVERVMLFSIVTVNVRAASNW